VKKAKEHLCTYEELAEESFHKWGYYYPPKTWEELYAWDAKTLDKFLKKGIDEDVKKTKLYVSLFDTINDFGFYLTFQKLDYEMLNNVLYQTGRQKLLDSGMMSSGTDHCHVLLNVLNTFACNDFSVIDYFFPKNLEHSKGKFYTEVSVNLLKVLYYHEDNLKDEALKKAEIFLSKKNKLFAQNVVLYFKALIHEDAEAASNCLQELCSAYQKMEHSVMKLRNKLAKYFAPEIHGLYRFARLINPDLFHRIKQPEHFCFSKEFESWQQENNYPKGKIFYQYPDEMDYMNKLFAAELPVVALHRPYSYNKNLFKDVEKFAADLTENVKKINNSRC
jgi:maltose-binding protein MalE